MTWKFVYAADSGGVNAVLDWVHKIVSPSTYACSLCAVTHGVWGEKTEWREALAALPGEKQFYHRDEFTRAHPDRPAVSPAVWLVDGDRWMLAMGPSQWPSVTTVGELALRLHLAVAGGSP